MPPHTNVAAEYASSVADPVRYRLVGLLSAGPRTAASLASELDAGEETITRHAEALRDLGVLEASDDGQSPIAYGLLRDPILHDTAWAQLPVEARRAAAAAAVTQMSAAATAAVDRGGFDRDDIHITRTAVDVDEDRWRLMRHAMDGSLHALGDLAEQPPPKGDGTFRATAIMMLFSDEQQLPPPRPPRRPADADGADAEPVLRRSWALVEELHDALVLEPVDWDRVEQMAGQLRLIARASKGEAGSSPAAVPLRVVPAHDPAISAGPGSVVRAVLDALLIYDPAPLTVGELARIVEDETRAEDAVAALVEAGLAHRSEDDLVRATRTARRFAAMYGVP